MLDYINPNAQKPQAITIMTKIGCVCAVTGQETGHRFLLKENISVIQII